MSQEINKTEDYIPNEKYDKTITDHDYDGIKELNNPAPMWLMIVFLVTISFSLIYVVRYFGFPGNGNDQYSEYKKTMAEAKNGNSTPSSTTAATTSSVTENAASTSTNSAAAIAEGKKLFSEKGCIACHGMSGEGNAVGPNLTDKFWINGCSKEAIIKVITEGKPEKGMTPYKTVMNETQIKNLVEFILGSLAGSNPANAKAPQGDECK